MSALKESTSVNICASQSCRENAGHKEVSQGMERQKTRIFFSGGQSGKGFMA